MSVVSELIHEVGNLSRERARLTAELAVTEELVKAALAWDEWDVMTEWDHPDPLERLEAAIAAYRKAKGEWA